MVYYLNEIADIYFGPYEKAQTEGELKYLVSSHFDELFEPTRFKESFINTKKETEKYLLQSNDVILAGKGQRIFAWAYKAEYGKVIPSSLFYILKPFDSSKVIGEYLAILLNSEEASYTLKALSGGTAMPSIKKKELEQVKVFIPPLARQKQIVKMSMLCDKDIELAAKLLEKKKALKIGLLNILTNTNKTSR